MIKKTQSNIISEDQVEFLGLDFFKELGFEYKNGYEINPEQIKSERDDLKEVILKKRLSLSLKKLNPTVPDKIIKNSIVQLLNPNIPGLLNVIVSIIN